MNKGVKDFWIEEYKELPSAFWLNAREFIIEQYRYNKKEISLSKDELSRLEAVLQAVKDLGIEKEWKRRFNDIRDKIENF